MDLAAAHGRKGGSWLTLLTVAAPGHYPADWGRCGRRWAGTVCSSRSGAVSWPAAGRHRRAEHAPRGGGRRTTWMVRSGTDSSGGIAAARHG